MKILTDTSKTGSQTDKAERRKPNLALERYEGEKSIVTCGKQQSIEEAESRQLYWQRSNQLHLGIQKNNILIRVCVIEREREKEREREREEERYKTSRQSDSTNLSIHFMRNIKHTQSGGQASTDTSHTDCVTKARRALRGQPTNGTNTAQRRSNVTSLSKRGSF